MPREVYQLSGVVELNLENNDLKHIISSVRKLTGLRKLNTRRNWQLRGKVSDKVKAYLPKGCEWLS